MLNSFPKPSTALVIGASGGIGLALVRQLLDSDGVGQVVACARSPDRSESLNTLSERHGQRLDLVALDVTCPQTIAATAERLKQARLRPQLVLNAAGLLHDDDGLAPEKRLEDLDLESLHRVFAVNALGPALCLRHFLPLMSRDGKAVFAALSARVGSIGDNRLGGWYAYRSSKAALNQLLRTASIEARRRFANVIIAALHPGTTDTGLSAPFQANVPDDKLFSPEFVAERLLKVIDGLDNDDSGGFFAWDGQSIPW
ncbi:SDR family NAD(P)-dependent oxidoreductase [Wenzhouxiangella limi]|uniref:SDR family NAD(P)-dependent oxidoreductase n=1 Tax=Wenzhouxiangella limi TaxID=2707351 RepID=A0A845V1A7_9GAMM|nr:SDR family NAD(P)-dependent oxidoreductase [Wenzhouxiangella limi]NDY96514.1 SDR family NAD(P)-dependent oxidoreductase [Wenzhouxiangella limi]